MKQRAVEKINSEMQKKPEDGQLEIIGHYLIDRAEKSERIAELILQDGKSIEGARAEVRRAAEKVKVGSMAMMGAQDVLAIIDTYYGIDSLGGTSVATQPAQTVSYSLTDLI